MASNKEKFEPIAREIATAHGLDPDIFVRQINAESGFNPSAKSPVGAMGLGQLMPGTAKSLGVQNPLDPIENLNGAAKLMSQNLKTYGGDYKLALAAYNGGGGGADYLKKNPQYFDNPDYSASPSAWKHQTADYVKKILGGSNSQSSPNITPPPINVSTPKVNYDGLSKDLVSDANKIYQSAMSDAVTGNITTPQLSDNTNLQNTLSGAESSRSFDVPSAPEIPTKESKQTDFFGMAAAYTQTKELEYLANPKTELGKIDEAANGGTFLGRTGKEWGTTGLEFGITAGLTWAGGAVGALGGPLAPFTVPIGAAAGSGAASFINQKFVEKQDKIDPLRTTVDVAFGGLGGGGWKAIGSSAEKLLGKNAASKAVQVGTQWLSGEKGLGSAVGSNVVLGAGIDAVSGRNPFDINARVTDIGFGVAGHFLSNTHNRNIQSSKEFSSFPKPVQMDAPPVPEYTGRSGLTGSSPIRLENNLTEVGGSPLQKSIVNEGNNVNGQAVVRSENLKIPNVEQQPIAQPESQPVITAKDIDPTILDTEIAPEQVQSWQQAIEQRNQVFMNKDTQSLATLDSETLTKNFDQESSVALESSKKIDSLSKLGSDEYATIRTGIAKLNQVDTEIAKLNQKISDEQATAAVQNFGQEANNTQNFDNTSDRAIQDTAARKESLNKRIKSLALDINRLENGQRPWNPRRVAEDLPSLKNELNSLKTKLNDFDKPPAPKQNPLEVQLSELTQTREIVNKKLGEEYGKLGIDPSALEEHRQFVDPKGKLDLKKVQPILETEMVRMNEAQTKASLYKSVIDGNAGEYNLNQHGLVQSIEPSIRKSGMFSASVALDSTKLENIRTSWNKFNSPEGYFDLVPEGKQLFNQAQSLSDLRNYSLSDVNNFVSEYQASPDLRRKLGTEVNSLKYAYDMEMKQNPTEAKNSPLANEYRSKAALLKLVNGRSFEPVSVNTNKGQPESQTAAKGFVEDIKANHSDVLNVREVAPGEYSISWKSMDKDLMNPRSPDPSTLDTLMAAFDADELETSVNRSFGKVVWDSENLTSTMSTGEYKELVSTPEGKVQLAADQETLRRLAEAAQESGGKIEPKPDAPTYVKAGLTLQSSRTTSEYQNIGLARAKITENGFEVGGEGRPITNADIDLLTKQINDSISFVNKKAEDFGMTSIDKYTGEVRQVSDIVQEVKNNMHQKTAEWTPILNDLVKNKKTPLTDPKVRKAIVEIAAHRRALNEVDKLMKASIAEGTPYNPYDAYMDYKELYDQKLSQINKDADFLEGITKLDKDAVTEVMQSSVSDLVNLSIDKASAKQLQTIAKLFGTTEDRLINIYKSGITNKPQRVFFKSFVDKFDTWFDSVESSGQVPKSTMAVTKIGVDNLLKSTGLKPNPGLANDIYRAASAGIKGIQTSMIGPTNLSALQGFMSSKMIQDAKSGFRFGNDHLTTEQLNWLSTQKNRVHPWHDFAFSHQEGDRSAIPGSESTVVNTSKSGFVRMINNVTTFLGRVPTMSYRISSGILQERAARIALNNADRILLGKGVDISSESGAKLRSEIFDSEFARLQVDTGSGDRALLSSQLVGTVGHVDALKLINTGANEFLDNTFQAHDPVSKSLYAVGRVGTDLSTRYLSYLADEAAQHIRLVKETTKAIANTKNKNEKLQVIGGALTNLMVYAGTFGAGAIPTIGSLNSLVMLAQGKQTPVNNASFWTMGIPGFLPEDDNLDISKTDYSPVSAASMFMNNLSEIVKLVSDRKNTSYGRYFKRIGDNVTELKKRAENGEDWTELLPDIIDGTLEVVWSGQYNNNRRTLGLEYGMIDVPKTQSVPEINKNGFVYGGYQMTADEKVKMQNNLYRTRKMLAFFLGYQNKQVADQYRDMETSNPLEAAGKSVDNFTVRNQ